MKETLLQILIGLVLQIETFFHFCSKIYDFWKVSKILRLKAEKKTSFTKKDFYSLLQIFTVCAAFWKNREVWALWKDQWLNFSKLHFILAKHLHDLFWIVDSELQFLNNIKLITISTTIFFLAFILENLSEFEINFLLIWNYSYLLRCF